MKPNSVYATEQTNANEKHAITVNGVGELLVTPDIAFILVYNIFLNCISYKLQPD
jgi:hypothetical protein